MFYGNIMYQFEQSIPNLLKTHKTSKGGATAHTCALFLITAVKYKLTWGISIHSRHLPCIHSVLPHIALVKPTALVRIASSPGLLANIFVHIMRVCTLRKHGLLKKNIAANLLVFIVVKWSEVCVWQISSMHGYWLFQRKKKHILKIYKLLDTLLLEAYV